MSLPGSDVRPPLPERMRPATVLLADDHRLFTDGLVHLLIDQLRVIGTVTDGPALIEAARRLQPDVIIMDLSMPNMSGLDALRQLRHDGLDSKVIVLTMHADARLATEALRAGASGFVLEEESGERALDGVGHADQDDRPVALDETWLRFVPIRLPSTRIVQERLPAGAAAVVLNRSHQHYDLVLALNAADMQLFEGIDGRRRIAEIIDGSSTVAPDHAWRFFQRLWWYDQVTFDTSNATVERHRLDGRA